MGIEPDNAGPPFFQEPSRRGPRFQAGKYSKIFRASLVERLTYRG